MTETLIMLLVKSVLLAAITLSVAGLLRRFASRRVSASARHLVCVGGFAALVLLPALSVVLPAWHVASVVAVAPSVAPVRSPPAPNSGGAGGRDGVASLPGISSSEAATPPVLTPPGLGAGGLQTPETGGTTTAILLYAAVAAALLARLAFGHLSVWRMVRRAKSVPDLTFGGVPVRESAEVAVPLTVGVGRAAVIVLPDGFAKAASPERMGAVLAHEAAHIRRSDYLSQTFADVVCAVYFVNPLVWFLSAAMRGEAERAADDRVLADNSVRPSEYAAHLLETVRGVRGRRGVPDLAVTIARRANVSARISAVLATNASRVSQVSLLDILALVLTYAAVAGSIGSFRVARDTELGRSHAVSLDQSLHSATTQSPFRKVLADGTAVEIESVAASGFGEQDEPLLWKPDGELIPYPNNSRPGMHRFNTPFPETSSLHRFIVSLRGPRASNYQVWESVRMDVVGGDYRSGTAEFGDTKQSFVTRDVQLKKPSTTATVNVYVSRTDWHTILAVAAFADGKGEKLGGANISGGFRSGKENFETKVRMARPVETAKGAQVTVTHEIRKDGGFANAEHRFVAETWQGKQITGQQWKLTVANSVPTSTVSFNGIPLARIKSFRVEARVIDQITFTGVALKPHGVSPIERAKSGRFRTIATVPFQPGRSFRTTANGEAVIFTIQTAPETDPLWTQGRRNVTNAILRTHDTAPMNQRRRVVLIKRDGTRYDLPCYASPVGNDKQRALWEKAIGKPVRYGQFENRWQLCEVNFPKAWLPRLREVHLEARRFP